MQSNNAREARVFGLNRGTTGVACVNTNRNFIGIEKVGKYFEIAEKRIKDAICG